MFGGRCLGFPTDDGRPVIPALRGHYRGGPPDVDQEAGGAIASWDGEAPWDGGASRRRLPTKLHLPWDEAACGDAFQLRATASVALLPPASQAPLCLRKSNLRMSSPTRVDLIHHRLVVRMHFLSPHVKSVPRMPGCRPPWESLRPHLGQGTRKPRSLPTKLSPKANSYRRGPSTPPTR